MLMVLWKPCDLDRWLFSFELTDSSQPVNHASEDECEKKEASEVKGINTSHLLAQAACWDRLFLHHLGSDVSCILRYL